MCQEGLAVSSDTLREVTLGGELYCQDLFRRKKWGNVGGKMGPNDLWRIADSVGSIASVFSCVELDLSHNLF